MEAGEAELVALARKERECWNEKKLELRLGPPGEENWSMEGPVSVRGQREMDHESLLSPGPFKSNSFWQQPKMSPSSSSFLHFSSTQESCSTKGLDFQNPEKKAPAGPAVPNSSQKRTAPAPVVGWPPIRSSRRNLASSSASKPGADSPNEVLHKAGIDKTSVEAASGSGSGNGKGLFVKINMDGVPIGRKVDLKAYDSYAKLSAAVDELFRGLLAAQADSTANKEGGITTCILDGSGEYTLVYEDNEGDRMLVGDVPWRMFVSTVKRLRVLKSSDVSALSRKSGFADAVASGKQRRDTGLSLP